MTRFTPTLQDTPPLPGTYALLLHLRASITMQIERLGSPTLHAGDYVYCGSARGPGGLRARLRRHGVRDKPRHWHVDHLALAAVPVGAFYRVGAERLECDWANLVCSMPEATTPIRGFGSSDCRCMAHLARFDYQTAMPLLAATLKTPEWDPPPAKGAGSP